MEHPLKFMLARSKERKLNMFLVNPSTVHLMQAKSNIQQLNNKNKKFNKKYYIFCNKLISITTEVAAKFPTQFNYLYFNTL